MNITELVLQYLKSISDLSRTDIKPAHHENISF